LFLVYCLARSSKSLFDKVSSTRKTESRSLHSLYPEAVKYITTMSKATQNGTSSKKCGVERTTRLHLTAESFEHQPTVSSLVLTGCFLIAVLVAIEQLGRYVLGLAQNLHPILESEINRQVLARHAFVDCTSLFVIAFLAVRNRHILSELRDGFLGRKEVPKPFENRCFMYHGEAFRILTIFSVYQVKNLYDTVIWNDGPEYIVHHVLALATSVGGLYQGLHFYGVFFMGISEVSTCILCVLANFDDDYGVKGLGDAFPITKVVIAGVFVLSFIICRVVMWPYCAYYCTRDITAAFASDAEQMKSTGRRIYFRFIYISLSLLTLIQGVFLVQMYIMGKPLLEELLNK